MNERIIVTPELLTAWGVPEEGIAKIRSVFGDCVLTLDGGLLLFISSARPTPWPLYDAAKTTAMPVLESRMTTAWETYEAATAAADTYRERDEAERNFDADSTDAYAAFLQAVYDAFVTALHATEVQP